LNTDPAKLKAADEKITAAFVDKKMRKRYDEKSTNNQFLQDERNNGSDI